MPSRREYYGSSACASGELKPQIPIEATGRPVGVRVAPGACVLVRDAAWRVVQVDPTSSGIALHVVGMSEEVGDREAPRSRARTVVAAWRL